MSVEAVMRKILHWSNAVLPSFVEMMNYIVVLLWKRPHFLDVNLIYFCILEFHRFTTMLIINQNSDAVFSAKFLDF